MKTIVGIDSSELRADPSVAAIGVFDGVHLGHQSIIIRAVEVAKSQHKRSMVITFDRHPKETVKPGSHPPLLTSLQSKENLIRDLGAQLLLILEFSPSLAEMTPARFLELIHHRAGVETLVIGENLRLGAQGSGDIDYLKNNGPRHGIEVIGMPLLTIDGKVVSSTYVRSLLRHGDISKAAELLGRFPLLTGKVVPGHGRGGRLGFHTANIKPREKAMVPGEGVYAGYIWIDGIRYSGAINIGRNPTFGNERRQLEVYIIEFSGDLYGADVTLEFRMRLREEITFASPERLSEQITEDVKRIERILEAGVEDRRAQSTER